MVSKHVKYLVLVAVLALTLVSAAAMAQTPAEAIADVVANSGVFPAGTSIANLNIDGTTINIDLSAEAVAFPFTDTQSDAYTEVLFGAVAAWPEINAINITSGGVPVMAFLPAASEQAAAGGASLMSLGSAPSGIGFEAAQNPQLSPSVTPLSDSLAGKLIVLGPSHGAYATSTSWYKVQRTFSGPNAVTNNPPGRTPKYQPSDYYFWTKGFQWPMYYEDDMSPEHIRLLYTYCKAAGAETFVNRNLDKTAGAFPWAQYGYANPGFDMQKWQTACKYYLEDMGGIPSWVWNTSDVSAQSDKDLRARAYYVNYLMQTLGYNKDNTVYVAWHSNAATACGTQAQARGTEDFNALTYTNWKTQQAQSPAFATSLLNGVINSIRNEYDGYWAEEFYNKTTTPVPPEWCTSYGTYRGYKHDGPSTPSNTDGWQNRGMKSGNYGEIRECKCPASLVELVFHDNWKFYPDQAFHVDPIFRATVTWGAYEGISNFFGVTPRPRLAASVDSVSFPTLVGPGAAINGTVVMKNLGQAWCWGKKMIGTLWSDYNIWRLAGTSSDQFGQTGTKIDLANDGYYYPGDTATFNVSMTAPATTGLYTTSWQMLKDDQRGGAFGDVASAQIQVDADPPVITITSPTASDYAYGQVKAEFSAVDALSSVASVSADIDGVAVTNGQVVSWLSLGNHTLAVTAEDIFGNSTSQSVTFSVVNSAGLVTVGGWIELADKKATCGFECQYAQGDPAPIGNLTYQDHDTGMTVKSDSIVAMGIVGNHAWFYGTCTVDGTAGHWFRVDVIDNGEPGSNDVFNIQLDTGYSKGDKLGGGNVTIH